MGHRIFPIIAVLPMLLIILAATAILPKPIKIMLIGDSITEGGEGRESYRYYLNSYLRDSNISFDFVGSKYGGKDAAPSNDSTFDEDHEGHWGWRADSMLQHIGQWSRSTKPDIALIHLGTNDFYQEEKAGIPAYVHTTLEDLSAIVDTLRKTNPTITIFIAQLIPAYFDEWVDSLNTRIPLLAKAKSTAQSRVIAVDLNSGMLQNHDFGDGLHPNDFGRRKIAAGWFKAIMAFYGTLPPPHFNCSGSSFTDSVTIALESVDSTQSIRYSFDTTKPTSTSPVYSGPWHFKGDTSLTINACSFSKNGKQQSSVVSRRIVVAYDTTSPTILHINVGSLRNEFLIVFSKPIDSASACDIANYSLSANVRVIAAHLDDKRTNVILTTSKLTDTTSYTIEVRNIQDNTLRANRIAEKTRVSCIARPTGFAIWQHWLNVTAPDIATLEKQPTFPDKPDGRDTVNKLAGPVDWKDAYASRIIGYLYPPVTGAYTFWLSADDFAEFRLSSDSSTEKSVAIAKNPAWTFTGQWEKVPEQRSGSIYLQAEKRYYFECLHIEGSGGDHVDVAWKIPGREQEIIQGVYIAPQQ